MLSPQHSVKCSVGAQNSEAVSILTGILIWFCRGGKNRGAHSLSLYC